MTTLLHRRFWAVVAGVLITQLGWILVMPSFGGIDEHEHVFKASAVAHGDFSPHHEASTQGWGEFVTVPAGLADAARPECSILGYTHTDNCVGFANPDGTVRIASSAARYNPAYYLVIGTVARPFSGDTALYVMRAVTSLLCALLIAAAFVVTRSWSRTSWPLIALLLGLTPTAVYSTTTVAPNGVEICGGLLLWCCLVGLRADAPRRVRPDALLVLAAAASVPLLAVRTLGPLWWLLAVVGALITVGVPRAREVLRLRSARLFVAVSVLAGLYGFGWSLIARSNGFVDEAPNNGSPWPEMYSQWLLWFFQTIAAAPLRNEYVPIVVYAIGLILIGLATFGAFRAGDTRLRVSLLYILLAASVVGIGASAVSFAASGYAWQGRYFYPFTVGFLVVVGLALDRRPPKLVSPAFAALVVGVGIAVMQIVSQIAVRDRGVRTSLLVISGRWHVPSSALLILLAALGTAVLVAAAAGRVRAEVAAPSPRTRELVHR